MSVKIAFPETTKVKKIPESFRREVFLIPRVQKLGRQAVVAGCEILWFPL